MSKKINRNDPCPCGSNKKYKQCCLKKESALARYTPEGKFKFSAEVLSPDTIGKAGGGCVKLFQRLSDSLATEQKQAVNRHHVTKTKEPIGKKALRKAQAKEDRIVSEKLNQHNFQFLDTDLTKLPEQSSVEGADETDFVPETFVLTEKDYRVSEKEDSHLEENN
ncbi:SEC-C motif family protein [Chlamydia ibidis]|uniref:SEC-C motif family protein n=2 Tax=Chlamydia ibidis TaxID=1405396 RepID=S7KFZ9_9CHLA|nr:SEC-C metal-binding domain-containing protein [Chlamydia ibidis]EPP35111.1 SEC-C motif family protein [Chlamydia ibidis]EQM62618.1 SEC-C motif family protein [Chlamydia ibidis 10-1398/6]